MCAVSSTVLPLCSRETSQFSETSISFTRMETWSSETPTSRISPALTSRSTRFTSLASTCRL